MNATEATVAAQEQALSAVRATQETVVTFLKPFAALAEPLFDATSGAPLRRQAALAYHRRRAVVRLRDRCPRRSEGFRAGADRPAAQQPCPVAGPQDHHDQGSLSSAGFVAATAIESWRDVPPRPALVCRRRHPLDRPRYG